MKSKLKNIPCYRCDDIFPTVKKLRAHVCRPSLMEARGLTALEIGHSLAHEHKRRNRHKLAPIV